MADLHERLLEHAAEIRRLNAELERRVEERTTQPASAGRQRDQELTARQRAEEARREQSRFLSVLLETVAASGRKDDRARAPHSISRWGGRASAIRNGREATASMMLAPLPPILVASFLASSIEPFPSDGTDD